MRPPRDEVFLHGAAARLSGVRLGGTSMQNLHIWDVRLDNLAIRANANEILRVGENTPLATMAMWVIGQSDGYFHNDVRVTIYCHGIDAALVLDPKTGTYPLMKTQGGF